MSIYSLEGGLELTGQYFFSNEQYSQIYLNGNNLTRVYQYSADSHLYTYNHEQIVSTTNIPVINNYSIGSKVI